jgi:hypothetical protein
MSELLRCPFCGSRAEPYPDGDMEGHSIMCTGDGALFGASKSHCPMTTFGYATHDDAAAAWNSRAELAAVRAELAQAAESRAFMVNAFHEAQDIAVAAQEQVAALRASRDALVKALDRLFRAADESGAALSATEDELCEAANDSAAEPIVREQAAAVLECRAALALARAGA